jgi:hypothetical protein
VAKNLFTTAHPDGRPFPHNDTITIWRTDGELVENFGKSVRIRDSFAGKEVSDLA